MDNFNFSLAEIASWTSEDSEVTIPALQRGLVWKPNQVELLWDSILRGFPIGSFLLSDITDGNDKGKYYLMDGQQRYNAISIGFNSVPDARAVLWIDINPPTVNNSTRIFWIKATTIPHPWGFKNDDDCSRLNTSEKRKALEAFNLKGNIYNNEFSLKSTWPVESNCPIPLWCLIQASSETNDAESFFTRICTLFSKTNFAFCEKVVITDSAKEYVIKQLYPAFAQLKNYRINCNHLPITVIEAETNGDNAEQTTLEVLFTRLNTGGTPISRDDLNYSAIKAYWSSIKEVNDSLAEKYMNPAKLVMLAFRLAFTKDTDNGLKSEISIRQLRNYAKRRKEQGEKQGIRIIEELYNEGALEKILYQIDDWLGVSYSDDSRTPSILRTLIARKSPDIYLLLMYFAYKNLKLPIDLTSAEVKSLAFGLHWFARDKQECVQEIFCRCKNGINRSNIQMGISRLMHDCKLLHIYSPFEIQGFIKIKESKQWRIWDSIPIPARDFFDRIFWYGNHYAEEMLLFAEREYLNSHFSNYDPARQDLWAEYNRPWDFDHIVARNHIVGKWGEYREYDKVWLDCIGNMAAISYEANRSKNDRKDYSEYINNQKVLLYDNAIKNLPDDITYKQDASLQFAQITYNRFCNIYSENYMMFKELFEHTILSKTLQKRKNCMIAIVNHYQDAIVHFAASDGYDYRLDREQDWAREWVGVGVIRNDYMACFEWRAQLNNDTPQYAEIGIRKSPRTRVTKENMKKLTGKQVTDDELNPWWYMIEDCLSIDINFLIEKFDFYLNKIP